MTTDKLHQMVIDLNVRIPMRDCVQTVCDIYRPDPDGQWPVVLFRCPYDRKDPAMGQMRIVDPAWLCRQGFVVIVQDTRGRGESEGEFNMVYQEVDDGYDTVEWAAAQPWSTGAVGIYGSSYMGTTSYQATASKAPHLKAAVAFAGATRMAGNHLTGNIPDACFLVWYAYVSVMMTIQRADMAPDKKADLLDRVIEAISDPVAAASKMPLSELDVISNEELAPYWLSDFIREPNLPEEPRGYLLADDHDIGGVALLHIAGYRDFISDDGFALAADLAGNETHRFIAGPFTHRGPYSGFTGGRELPGTSSPAGPLGWGPLIAAWFDIHLRDGTGENYPLAMPWLTGEPVRYYLEGENRWHNNACWPPATNAVKWSLSSCGNARSANGDGKLLKPGEQPSGNQSDSFKADPHNPFPSCGGAFGIPEQGPEGIQDQRLVDGRDDVLVYTSEVLVEPVKIAGCQLVKLRFSSSAPDADLCVKLVDVEPSGFACNIAEGNLRTRYRNGGTTAWLVPGESEEITVTLHNTAYLFKPGHRIRVMIAGASYPQLSRNLHTKTVPEFGTLNEAVVAEHVVYCGPEGSELILNQIESE